MPKRKDTRPKARPKVCRYFDTREALRRENTTDSRKRAKGMLEHWSGRHTAKDVRGFYSKRGKHPCRGTYNHASVGQAIARLSMTCAKPTAKGGKAHPHRKVMPDLTRYK